MTEVSRTIGEDRLAFEFVATFTHSTEMHWLLPGVPPTGKRVELAAVVIVQFDGDQLASEQIYWDQASVLVQVGLLEPGDLPVAGAQSARKVLDPSLPSNELIIRAGR
jgi:carboxymethylenebutenolidase